MKLYVECLKENQADHHKCRELSKHYLNCRMNKDLMKKEDLSNLGFGENGEYNRIYRTDSKESSGFIAGTGVKPSSKGRIW
jgi:hypothetical protein